MRAKQAVGAEYLELAPVRVARSSLLRVRHTARVFGQRGRVFELAALLLAGRTVDYFAGGNGVRLQVPLMYRVGTTRRYGSWLALAAMALQLVLSFGHVHVHGANETPAIKVAGTHAPGAPSSPDHPANDADDYCAICAIIHLASTTFLPEPVQLPVPFVTRTVEHIDRVTTIFLTPHRSYFQSRAPPLV